jgi:hypothetical protein
MTAVEFLIKELSKSIHFHRVLNEVNGNSTTEKDILNEALELEKQQIKDAYESGYKDGDAILGYEYFDNSESYYKKTYKKNDDA